MPSLAASIDALLRLCREAGFVLGGACERAYIEDICRDVVANAGFRPSAEILAFWERASGIESDNDDDEQSFNIRVDPNASANRLAGPGWLIVGLDAVRRELYVARADGSCEAVEPEGSAFAYTAKSPVRVLRRYPSFLAFLESEIPFWIRRRAGARAEKRAARRSAASAKAVEKITALLRPLRKETWLLTPTRATLKGGLAVPQFGGTPYAERGDTWPIDPTTGEPMWFVLQFMAGPMLYVVFIDQMSLVETGLHVVDGTGGIVVRRYGKASAERRVTLAVPKERRRRTERARIERSPSFPSWEEVAGSAIFNRCIKAFPDDSSKVYRRITRKLGETGFDINGTKLFGYQTPLQEAIRARCPDCRKRMDFLAQTAVFLDVDLNIYLFRCARHRSRIAAEAQYT